MAFTQVGFATIAASKKGNAPSMYSYISAEAKATVTGAGYFNSLVDTLAVGDLLYHYDTATPTATLSIVLSNNGTVVDVTAGTALGVT
jgi:hypothetical protein|tara:strand:+ start:76 stop:339 length:264 start_codon:yes stop_codon:yes gene_type:complete